MAVFHYAASAVFADAAFLLAAAGRLALDRLITEIRPLDAVQSAFEAIETQPSGIKTLIRCSL